ncbi:MAG: ketoacyl-ACP synthase III [Planctomycetia bacterium]|nr:ketoacyl-ACP synthase III [Planctomycetia bacterium]
MVAAKISAISCYLPTEQLRNEELARVFSGWTPEKITRKLGIESRPIAAPGETAVDMAEKAGNALFDAGYANRDEIDFVVLCTQSPDYFLPTSACLLQNRLGLPQRCGAFDINLGCSGYIYGLGVCKGLLEAGLAKRILFITSETYSKYINKFDRASRPLFGDGAAASLLVADMEQSESEHWMGNFEFGTDGAGADLLMVPAGAHRLPSSEATAEVRPDAFGSFRSKDNLFMNGPGIFTFSIDRIPPLIDRYRKLCQQRNMTIDRYVFHQANRYMLDRLQVMCELDPAVYYNQMKNRGNTVSSSIPIALVDAMNDGFLKPGLLTLLVGFGVGLSWGGCLIRLDDDFRSVVV